MTGHFFCAVLPMIFHLCLYPVTITINRQNTIVHAQNLCCFIVIFLPEIISHTRSAYSYRR